MTLHTLHVNAGLAVPGHMVPVCRIVTHDIGRTNPVHNRCPAIMTRGTPRLFVLLQRVPTSLINAPIPVYFGPYRCVVDPVKCAFWAVARVADGGIGKRFAISKVGGIDRVMTVRTGNNFRSLLGMKVCVVRLGTGKLRREEVPAGTREMVMADRTAAAIKMGG